MSSLRRVALASAHGSEEPTAVALAILGALRRSHESVQYFSSWARPFSNRVIEQVTGLPGRHLDSWLMPPDVCRHVFARGARRASLCLVEGAYGDRTTPITPDTMLRAGEIDPLVEALELPTIAVIDAQNSIQDHLNRPSGRFDAIVLDRVPSAEAFTSLSRLAKLVHKKPVIGGLESLPHERAALAQADPRGVDSFVVDALARSFLKFANLEAMFELSESKAFPETCCSSGHIPPVERLRVAYARDAAFGGYFPDTLEALEDFGAELVEFSPLKSERLPDEIDLVLIGCGFADEYAAELASNLSLLGDLRAQVCHGMRVYAESGGAAYLGRSMIVGNSVHAMAGILPFDATLENRECCGHPVEETLGRDSWLGQRGTVVRGYRTGRWRLDPAPQLGDCPGASGRLSEEGGLFFRKHAVGGLIHLHLGALPQVVGAFLGASGGITDRSRTAR